MKFRNGYISNSSSCSFCIFGIQLNDKLKEIIIEKYKKQDTYEILFSEVENFPFRDYKLQIESVDDYNDYIGISPWEMGEDETRKEFENRVNSLLRELFNIEDIEDIEGSWIHKGSYQG